MDRLQAALSPKPAAVATDKLWQFQLRKENKALLEQLQENERRRQYDTAESDRKLKESADKIIALESRLAEHDREKIKDDQARREFMKEDAAFKTNLKNFLEGRLSEGELLVFMTWPSATTSAAVPSSRDGRPTGSVHSSGVPSSGLVPSHQSKPKPVTVLPNAADQESTLSDNITHIHGQKTTRSHPKPTIANRRPVTRSRNRRTDSPTETHIESPQARPDALSIPRLSQGMSHIKNYYNNANEAFKQLNVNEAQMEVDFVSAFISGITDSKIKNRLIAELQQLHPSRNRKDGRIEVLCDWDDIPEGLRKAGLLSPAKEFSRRKHRILGDLSDLGF